MRQKTLLHHGGLRFETSVVSFHIFNFCCSEILLPVSLSKPFYILYKLTNPLVTIFQTHMGTLFRLGRRRKASKLNTVGGNVKLRSSEF